MTRQPSTVVPRTNEWDRHLRLPRELGVPRWHDEAWRVKALERVRGEIDQCLLEFFLAQFTMSEIEARTAAREVYLHLQRHFDLIVTFLPDNKPITLKQLVRLAQWHFTDRPQAYGQNIRASGCVDCPPRPDVTIELISQVSDALKLLHPKQHAIWVLFPIEQDVRPEHLKACLLQEPGLSDDVIRQRLSNARTFVANRLLERIQCRIGTDNRQVLIAALLRAGILDYVLACRSTEQLLFPDEQLPPRKKRSRQADAPKRHCPTE